MTKEELIHKYLRNMLSEEERSEFERLRATDSDFNKELQLQDNIKTVFGKADYDDIKHTLESFETPIKTYSFRRLAIAASFVLLVGLAGFWYLNKPSVSEKLYSEYFKPYRNIVQPILRGEQAKDDKTKTFLAYENKQYDAALNGLNTLLEKENSDILRFYKANVLIELNDPENAIQLLKDNLSSSDSLYDKKLWYLSMGHLQLNDTKKAKHYLKKLIDTQSSFKMKERNALLEAL